MDNNSKDMYKEEINRLEHIAKSNNNYLSEELEQKKQQGNKSQPSRGTSVTSDKKDNTTNNKKEHFDEKLFIKKDWHDAIPVLLKSYNDRSEFDVALLMNLAKRLKLFQPENMISANSLSEETMEEICRHLKLVPSLQKRSIVRTNIPETTLNQFFIIIRGSVTASGRYRVMQLAEDIQAASSRRSQHQSSNSSRGSARVSVERSTPDVTTERNNDRSFILHEYNEIGDCFGEGILDRILYKHEMKICEWRVSSEDTLLLSLEKKYYLKHLAAIYETEMLDRIFFLKRTLLIPLFVGYPLSHMFEIVKQLKCVHYGTRSVIIRENDNSHDCGMFLIRKGECVVLKELDFTIKESNKEKGIDIATKDTEKSENKDNLSRKKYLVLARLRSGEYFGEMAILEQQRIKRYMFELQERHSKEKSRNFKSQSSHNMSKGDIEGHYSRPISIKKPTHEEMQSRNSSKENIIKGNEVPKRKASVLTVIATEVLVVQKETLVKFFTPRTILRMEEYAKDYFSEKEILNQYKKQKKWTKEKFRIVKSLLSKYVDGEQH